MAGPVLLSYGSSLVVRGNRGAFRRWLSPTGWRHKKERRGVPTQAQETLADTSVHGRRFDPAEWMTFSLGRWNERKGPGQGDLHILGHPAFCADW